VDAGTRGPVSRAAAAQAAAWCEYLAAHARRLYAAVTDVDEAEPLRTFGRTAGDLRRGVRYWMIAGTIARKRRARFADR